MTISFKCPHCKKPLRVNDPLAGKRAKCPACKQPIVIPAPIAPPADLEAFAAAALADPAAAAPQKEPAKNIAFTCAYCDEPVSVAAELAGKNTPCPSCRQIIRVPLPKEDKPKDWRGLDKKGPVAALINQPEQLDGAWGTEVKGRVSRTALEEAEALPEVEVESLGVGGWIRRLAIGAAVIGVVALIAVGVSRKKTSNQQVDALAQAREFAKKLAEDPKKKLHPVLAAEIEWADGWLRLRKDKVGEARDQFVKARAVCGEAAKDAPLDHDFFLIDLALSQLGMIGNDDQFRAKARLEWADAAAQKEIAQTLDMIGATEARVLAARELSNEFIPRKQAERALTFITKLNPGPNAPPAKAAPVLAQQGVLVFLRDPKDLDQMKIKAPDLAKAPLELAARLVYAEGNARKGNFEEAKKFVQANGPPLDQFDAAVGVASIIMRDPSNQNAATQAAPFVDHARKLHEKFKRNMSAWRTYQLCRVALRTPEHAAAAKELAKDLPGNFKRRVQLDWIVAQLDKGNGMAAVDQLIAEMPDPEGPTRGLAWVALARQLTVLGRDVPLPETDGDNALDRIFANIGIALGKQER